MTAFGLWVFQRVCNNEGLRQCHTTIHCDIPLALSISEVTINSYRTGQTMVTHENVVEG